MRSSLLNEDEDEFEFDTNLENFDVEKNKKDRTKKKAHMQKESREDK